MLLFSICLNYLRWKEETTDLKIFFQIISQASIITFTVKAEPNKKAESWSDFLGLMKSSTLPL